MFKVTHVSIKVSEGGHNLIAVNEFIAMPYEMRMNLLSTQSLTFLDENGDKIPLVEGVKYTADLMRSQKAGNNQKI